MAWPPRPGESLPGATSITGVRTKLVGYSLNAAHEAGAAKAGGFESILNITLDDIDYLEEAISSGVLAEPIDEVRANPPHGFNCVVNLPVIGIHEKGDRTATVRTIWEIAKPGAPPRLVSAFVKP